MRNTFISYHHRNDQKYKNHLLDLNGNNDIFVDYSVNTDEIDVSLPPQTIRRIIRDDYLRNSTVTILLCGSETRFRKHVDWELKPSMIDGPINKKSGILVINLHTTGGDTWHADLPGEKDQIYFNYSGSWITIETKSDFQSRFPDMPERILDNLLSPNVTMSVVPWSIIENQPENLRYYIEETAKVRSANNYDLSLQMRMRDHNPAFEFS
ncbi:MAG: TIR domain-containing protein [Paracoccaceae bacterium]